MTLCEHQPKEMNEKVVTLKVNLNFDDDDPTWATCKEQ